LTTALLANIGNQINAEGAGLIGDNGEILGVPGKALSHAVVSALAAEIAGGDAKGAAVGALAAELAAITMESRLFEPSYKNEAERQIHKLQEALTGNEAKTQTAKLIGALSGALISHTPEGAYSAANSAELVYRNNMTEHMLHQLSVDNQKDILAAEKGDKSAAERIIARRDAAITVTAVAAGGYALTYGGYILVAGSAEMAAAGRIALEGCKTNPALCLNNVGIFVADAIAPEAAVGTGVLATGAVKVLGNTQEGAKNLAGELSHVSKPLLSNAKPNTNTVTGLMEKEALYIERNSATETVSASETGIQWGKGNMKQGIPWEDYVGTQLPVDARLPKNFKTFDYYDGVTKTAISVKTMDTQTLSKLTKPNQIYSSLKGNIDAASLFKTYTLLDRKLNTSMIANREIRLAVPANTTKAQWSEINRAIEYGINQGVKVTVTQVK
uniref:endonuclease toxin domain-containing protein n=1 Tax=Photorhabdus temperata TaxID=574560 RepID=UPI00038A0356